jgi:hypothetical protein
MSSLKQDYLGLVLAHYSKELQFKEIVPHTLESFEKIQRWKDVACYNILSAL